MLRDALSQACAGGIVSVAVVAVTEDGAVVTAGSGYDKARFTLLGGLRHMEDIIAEGIEK